MINRGAPCFGTAVLIAQVLIFTGCSSSSPTTPVMNNGGSGGSATTGQGGSTGNADGGSATPIGAMCASGVKNKGACTTDPACFNTCGPLKSGIKNCTCAAAMWSCPTCAYDPAGTYTCYKLPSPVPACPADSTDPSGMNLPQSGGACTMATCSPCGSGTANAYRDSTNTPKIGYCVCSASDGTGTWSCASTTEWPPQS
jgi:hypothetical protein